MNLSLFWENTLLKFSKYHSIYSIIKVLVNISCEIWRIPARADPHRAHDCPFELWHISYKIQILQQPAKLSLTYPLLKAQSQHIHGIMHTCFWEKFKLWFFSKKPKTVLLISQQPNIAQRRFLFKTKGRISSITSYKDHCCSFFMSWVIKQQKCWIL